MSYFDQQTKSRSLAVGGVVLLHLAIGYAFVSGLAIRVIQHPPHWIYVSQLPEPTAPPPLPPPPPAKRTSEQPIMRDPVPVPPDAGVGPAPLPEVPDYPPFPTSPPTLPEPPKVSQARPPVPAASRASWVTNDDYPSAALRAEVQGVVGIDVAIGPDGRVTDCRVTASSGNELLDQTTCRLYARRARFEPARDPDGKPVASHRADRIRWQIPD